MEKVNLGQLPHDISQQGVNLLLTQQQVLRLNFYVLFKMACVEFSILLHVVI